MNVRPLLLFGLLLLTGCHADVTYRFDVHADNTVTVAIKEKLDDQFFTMAQNQAKGGDAFGFDAAKQSGWTASKSVDDEDNHILMMSRTVPMQSLNDAMTTGPNAIGLGKAVRIDPTSTATRTGLFTDQRTLTLTIPPLMPKDNSTAGNSNAGAAATMAAAIIGIHLELRTPGKLVDSNGDTTPDGFVRWTLSFVHPTQISYTAETVDVAHVILAVILAVAIVAVTISLVRRKKRSIEIQSKVFHSS